MRPSSEVLRDRPAPWRRTRPFQRVALAAAVSLAALVAPAGAAGATPAGAWPLDEGSGNLAHDTSGHHDDGTIQPGVSWVHGAFGTALSFDGTSGGVHVADAPALEPPVQVSVAAWVAHLGSPGQWRHIVSKGATGCVAASYALYSGPHGGLEFYVSNGRGHQYTLSPDAGTGVWDGNFHFVVGTFDGTVLRLYDDGTQVGSPVPDVQGLSYSLVDSNEFVIGDYPGCIAHTFNGWIRQVSVWSSALTPSEISGLMTASAPAGSPARGSPASGPGTDPTPATTTPVTTTPVTPLSAGSPSATGAAPRLTGLGLSPRSFPAPLRTHSDTRTVSVRYRDSQPARTILTVYRSTPGTVSGHSCRPLTTAPRRGARACRTWLPVSQMAHLDRAGPNRITVPRTRLIGPARRAGRYLLVAVPSRVGLRDAPHSVHFTVTRSAG